MIGPVIRAHGLWCSFSIGAAIGDIARGAYGYAIVQCLGALLQVHYVSRFGPGWPWR